MLVIEHDGDGLAEDRVAEELEALVVREPAVLVGVRAMGEGELQQLRIDLDLEVSVQVSRGDGLGGCCSTAGRRD
jgi:hypothetical protein